MFIKCDICQKVFSSSSNLKRHINKVHSDASDELNKLKIYKNSQRYNFSCDCGKNFTHERHFRAHKKIHSDSVQKKYPRRKCPLCDYCELKKHKILNHFKELHDINIETKELEFSTLEHFLSWKSNLENETCSKFIRKSKDLYKVLPESYEILHYCCHRSGEYKSKGKGIRQLKSLGSNKINAYCPASIKLKKFISGKCEVVFIENHIGHEAELRRLQLTPSERKDLADKISAGIPYERIIKEVKQSGDPAEQRRIHLLTKKDLHNIQNCLNRSSVNRKDNKINNPTSLEICNPSDAKIEHFIIKEDIEQIQISQNSMFIEINSEGQAEKNQMTHDSSYSLTQLEMLDSGMTSDHLYATQVDDNNSPPVMERKYSQEILEERKSVIMSEFSEILNKINSLEDLENLRNVINSHVVISS